jgi:hypothetical protein
MLSFGKITTFILLVAYIAQLAGNSLNNDSIKPSIVLSLFVDYVTFYVHRCGDILGNYSVNIIDFIKELDIHVVIDPLFELTAPLLSLSAVPLEFTKAFMKPILQQSYSIGIFILIVFTILTTTILWETICKGVDQHYKPSNGILVINQFTRRVFSILGTYFAQMSSILVEILKTLKLDKIIGATQDLLVSIYRLITSIEVFGIAYRLYVATHYSREKKIVIFSSVILVTLILIAIFVNLNLHLLIFKLVCEPLQVCDKGLGLLFTPVMYVLTIIILIIVFLNC